MLLKFSRQDIIDNIMADGNTTFPVQLNVTGSFEDGAFESSDTITAINPGQPDNGNKSGDNPGKGKGKKKGHKK